MKLSIKNLCVSSILCENKDALYLDPSMIENIKDFEFSKKSNFIKIKFVTTYKKELDLVVSFSDFKKWLKENKKEGSDIILSFLKDFLKNSKEKEDLEEIVDDHGNIMGDDDMPSNATNSMIVAPNFDLEKIYKTSIPKRARNYWGNYGQGFIVW